MVINNKIINFIIRIFFTTIKWFLFSFSLLFYFYSFIINLILFFFKFIYTIYLLIKLKFFNINLILKIFTILILFILTFLLFKFSIIENQYFFINYYNYDFSDQYLSKNRTFYYTFSLWWLIRIYLFYFLIYFFIIESRTIIEEHFLFIIFLPIIIIYFNHYSIFLSLFGSIINQIYFYNLKLKESLHKLYKKIAEINIINNTFLKSYNVVIFRSLIDYNKSAESKVLINNNNNNNIITINTRAESYKNDLFKLKKLKTILDYYEGFKILEKKNQLLSFKHNNLITNYKTKPINNKKKT